MISKYGPLQESHFLKARPRTRQNKVVDERPKFDEHTCSTFGMIWLLLHIVGDPRISSYSGKQAQALLMALQDRHMRAEFECDLLLRDSVIPEVGAPVDHVDAVSVKLSNGFTSFQSG